ncbi:hypothetical protein COP1_045652 [Malus domestica]
MQTASGITYLLASRDREGRREKEEDVNGGGSLRARQQISKHQAQKCFFGCFHRFSNQRTTCGVDEVELLGVGDAASCELAISAFCWVCVCRSLWLGLLWLLPWLLQG